ncbi:hypothetical protein Y032_0272g913 [Ancylostoma ceylanicum]|nr:hypothetical protein Y032_0272g913 [Ancylostoma ceylanicum]
MTSETEQKECSNLKVIEELTEPIRRQISALFSHIFENNAVQVAVARSYDRQTDTWSCGYRSIACMVDLARQRNPCETDYCMKSIFDFFQKVISEPNIEWDVFESANFGQHRPLADNNVTFVRLYPDLAFEEVPCHTPELSQDFHEPQLEFHNIKICSPNPTVITNTEADTRSEQSIR